MKSATSGQYSFARIPSVSIGRSAFDRSCNHKTAFDAGLLIPIFCDEALPGDTMTLRMETLARLATPIHPIMDNLTLDSFYFSVPMRLVWENFEKFMGARDNPADSTDFIIPEIVSPVGGPAVGSLSDYMGIPPSYLNAPHSAMWHRAYNLIYKEWFRAQHLQDSPEIHTDDGPDPDGDYVLLRRGKRHDYFTSCNPFAQDGPPVTMPIGSVAPVISTGDGKPIFEIDTGSGLLPYNLQATGGAANTHWNSTPPGAGIGDAFWDETKLEADLTNATAATINAIREAVTLQRLFEINARAGSRYTEQMRAHFGVVSSDQRLQRPEFLGGGSQSMNATPVAQTSETGTTPQGELAGFVVSTSGAHSFTKSFTEHCIIIGLVCVRADLNYQQGIARQFRRSTRYDFYWPELANLGEQSVLLSEILGLGGVQSAWDDMTFGYQERWAEYRYKASQISGIMRSSAPSTLDSWHLAQELVLPALNSAFIVENPPIARVVADSTQPDILFDSHTSFRHVRPMPTFSVPGLDRF